MFLFRIRQWEELEAEAIDLDFGSSNRWAKGRMMERDERILVVLEDLLAHC